MSKNPNKIRNIRISSKNNVVILFIELQRNTRKDDRFMMNTEFEKFEKSLVVTRYTSTACNEDLLNEFIHDITLKKEPQMIISTINNHLNNSLQNHQQDSSHFQ